MVGFEKPWALEESGRNLLGYLQEARRRLYLDIDELAEIAARHDAKGIKAKLKEIVPEFAPQENEGVL